MCHERLAGTRVCFVCFKRDGSKLKRTVHPSRWCSVMLLWDVLLLIVQLQPVKQCSRRHGPMVVENECIERREHYLTECGRGSRNGQKVTIRRAGGEEAFPLFGFCTAIKRRKKKPKTKARKRPRRQSVALCRRCDRLNLSFSLSLRAFLCPLSTATATARWVKGTQRCIN